MILKCKYFNWMRFFYLVAFLAVVIVLLVCVGVFDNGIQKENGTVIIVHVVLSSGKHTRTDLSDYPNDPYANETYYPFGKSELTNEGKVQMLKMGRKVRKRYNFFFSDIYEPKYVDAFSQNTDRAKSTIELFLTGLYPMTRTFTDWLYGFIWQPIPFNQANNTDKILSYSLTKCNISEKDYNDYMLQDNYIRQYAHLYEYISNNTGWLNGPYNLFMLSDYFNGMKSMGMDLPSWMQRVNQSIVNELLLRIIRIQSYSDVWKPVGTGYFFQKILDDTNQKILNNSNIKIHVYSGSIENIYLTLGTLGYNITDLPPSGSAVVFEIRKIDEEVFIQVIYFKDVQDEGEVLATKKCYQLCPWNNFVSEQLENLPTQFMCKRLKSALI